MSFHVIRGKCDAIHIGGRTISQLDWDQDTCQAYYRSAEAFAATCLSTWNILSPGVLPPDLKELPAKFEADRVRYIKEVHEQIKYNMYGNRSKWFAISSLTDNLQDEIHWRHYAENAYT